MKFLQKMQQVEAEPVQLGGERLMVVAAGGRAHAVPADVFELFFAPETPKEESDRVLVLQIQADGFHPVPKPEAKALGKKPAAKKTAPPPRQASAPSTAPTTETDGELTTGEAIMKAVAEGPRTQHEVIDRVCDILGWDRNNKDVKNRVYGNIWNRVKSGALIKKDCPETHLSKLYLPGGAK